MLGYRNKKRKNNILFIILLSLIVHGLLLFFLTRLPDHRPRRTTDLARPTVKLRVVPKPKVDQTQGEILDTPLQETAPPEKAKYLGLADHQAKKQMKPRHGSSQGDKPSHASGQQSDQAEQAAVRAPESPIPETTERRRGPGKQSLPRAPMRPKSYADLLPSGHFDHSELPPGGEYIEEDLPIGDALSVDMLRERFMSYHIKLRRDLELARYRPPLEEFAQDPKYAGLAEIRGKSTLLMVISRDGSLKDLRIVKSDDDHLVDRYILDVFKAGSPFAPLPQDYDQPEMRLVWGISYHFRM